jgi:hypothetical protein
MIEAKFPEPTEAEKRWFAQNPTTSDAELMTVLRQRMAGVVPDRRPGRISIPEPIIDPPPTRTEDEEQSKPDTLHRRPSALQMREHIRQQLP